MSKRVLVIGANLPALIVARALVNDPVVDQVTIVGSTKEARVSASLGPIFLWDSPAVREYMYQIGTASWLDIKNMPSLRKEVAWWGEKSLWRYHAKTGGDVESMIEPCGGRKEFSVISNGLEFLGRSLVQWIERDSMCRLIAGRVDSLRYDDGCMSAGYTTDRGNGDEKFDAIVNCAPRYVFEGLIRERPKWSETQVYFHTSPDAPEGFETKRHCLIYDGIEDHDWHRVSFDFRRRLWVYETTKENAKIPNGTFAQKIGAKMPKVHEEFHPDPRVVHCGRWAELEPEMLISDVVQETDKYVAKVHKILAWS